MKKSITKTKIVCTIGPSSDSPAIIRELILSGMNIARLNFSHGRHSEHGEKIKIIRQLSEELDRPVAILQDLAGPKIRTGIVPDPGIELSPGNTLILTTEKVEGNNNRVSVSDPDLPDVVKPGDRILLADGLMELRVQDILLKEIHCEVLNGGILTSNKGINLPTRSLRMHSLTSKDHDDLLFGLEMGVDLVALSFVRNAQDVMDVKNIIEKSKRNVPVIAKIEKHEAIDNIREILGVSDGLMVARGDLGVEIPLERVPVIQKQLIRMANEAGKPVITATQMLRSMVDSPRPTRAEAGDVANAVLDGTDAVMLSEETASGNYPVNAVRNMSKIAGYAETIYPHEKFMKAAPGNKTYESVAYSACVLAEQINASVIIAPTRSGRTATRISRFRPSCPVIAMSPDIEVVRWLSIFFGCNAFLIPEIGRTGNMISELTHFALKTGIVEKGDLVVITAGVPGGYEQATNMIEVVRI
ncbi:MAG: pyruvate kinase [Deltaproteobacteria bacterium]|nr:pyruvate kinase [Deltaproteobacteria bacterium]